MTIRELVKSDVLALAYHNTNMYINVENELHERFLLEFDNNLTIGNALGYLNEKALEEEVEFIEFMNDTIIVYIIRKEEN